MGTTCIDSVPIDPPLIDTIIINQGVDTTGTLIADWEQVSVRSLSPTRHDIKVTGLANNFGDPYVPGIFPQPSAPGLLMRLNVRIYDELPLDDSTVTLYIIDNLSETNFSDPHGNLIGTITNYNICDSCYCETWDLTGDSCFSGCLDTLPTGPYDTLVIDTFFRYWICQNWGQDQFGADSCLEWGNYSDPDSAANADSISIDQVPWTVWNPSTSSFTHGELSVVSITCICGDANNDDDISVGDPVFLINYIFKGGPFPAFFDCADVNNDDDVNVGDVVYMINYIFKGGPGYNCGF
jgi:hypothetical protein